jgi:hypothetical protein
MDIRVIELADLLEQRIRSLISASLVPLTAVEIARKLEHIDCLIPCFCGTPIVHSVPTPVAATEDAVRPVLRRMRIDGIITATFAADGPRWALAATT